MATPIHRHQSSLQDILNFSSSPPLNADLRVDAERRFYDIIDHFGDDDPEPKKYNRPRLVLLVYEHAAPGKSKDNVLRAFFRAMELPIDGPAVDFSISDSMLVHLLGFADHLVNNFFLPLMASTIKTPQPTPEYRSATIRTSSQGFVGTPTRLSGLRGDCLVRDRHRCVISRAFDREKARERMVNTGQMDDDDGQPIAVGDFGHLEVAHILPHSLVKTDSNSEQLDETRKTALEILNMFDNDVAHLINGIEIDRPRNALTLTHDLHQDFGRFEIYFTADSNLPHTYRIETFLPAELHPTFPITRTLYLTQDRTIEPPAPRLLAVHRAIAHILHFSAAGQYIHKILRSMEEQTARCDGSTQLGDLIRLRMENWLAT